MSTFVLMEKRQKKTALNEVQGISEIEIVSQSSIEKVNRFRRNNLQHKNLSKE